MLCRGFRKRRGNSRLVRVSPNPRIRSPDPGKPLPDLLPTKLIAVGADNAPEPSLESLPVVDNGSRYEENVSPRIREDTRSGNRALHLRECQVACVQHTEIASHQRTVFRNDGDLARVGKVRRRFHRRQAGRRSGIQGGETSGPVERPPPVMAPVVQSPIGLLQFCVVNRLRIVPLTGLHRSSAKTLKAAPDCFMGNTTANSTRPKISSKRSLPTCFIVFPFSFLVADFLRSNHAHRSAVGLMDCDCDSLRFVRGFRNPNRNLQPERQRIITPVRPALRQSLSLFSLRPIEPTRA
jgi:hypothetical protein